MRVEEIEGFIASLSAAEFGRLIAKAILDRPHSQYGALVSNALKQVSGWDHEWEEIAPLLKRLAETEADA